MLKRYCDRCGAEIRGNNFYYVAYKYAVPDSKKQVFQIKDKEWCVKCTKSVLIGKDEQNESND